MTNNSATGGTLVPYQSSYIAPPLEGQALLDFIQGLISGMTGIAGDLVRPRWQPEPPNMPANTVNWIAFGIPDVKADTNAVEFHVVPSLDQLPRALDHIDPQGDPDTLDPDSYDLVLRNEEFIVLCSFYGPNADLNAAVLRDGWSVSQNREALQLQGMGFVEAGRRVQLPTQVNDKWYYRVDMPLTFRRSVRRVYPVLDITSAPGTVDADTIERAINVTSNG